MPIVVNSNSSATAASFNLSRANDALRKAFYRYRNWNNFAINIDFFYHFIIRLKSIIKKNHLALADFTDLWVILLDFS